MKHQQFREMLPLLLYDELDQPEKGLLAEHLVGCAQCRGELEQIQKLHRILGERPEVSEELLQEARREFRNTVQTERTKGSFWEQIIESLKVWPMPYKVAFSGIATFVIGILIGRIAFGPAPILQQPPKTAKVEEDVFSRGDARISNIQFFDADPSDGQVEFAFETTTPMRVKGSVNDERVQKVLTYAVMNEQNPGIRLRAVNALGTQDRNPDTQVKSALIEALKSDENAGVRKEALLVLRKFPIDEEIKEALLHVLSHDKNPGLRVEVIKSLEGKESDQEVLNVLRDRVESDENNFIRIHARNVLEEVQEQ